MMDDDMYSSLQWLRIIPNIDQLWYEAVAAELARPS